MPHFVSPLRPRYSRAPAYTDLPQPKAPDSSPTPDEVPIQEPHYPETLCISEGPFKYTRDCSLVLLSQGISHRLVRDPNGPYQIFILPEHEDIARLQLALYRKENPPKEYNPPQSLSFSLQPLWVLMAPVVFTLVDFSNKANIHGTGISEASKVLKGEWWRSFTAQTLHADARHLASNLVIGYIVMNMITFRIPLLRLSPFIATAAAVANLGVSLTLQSHFKSLGFSSFVFAAIGCLAMMEFRLMPRESHGLIRRFAPLCGATALAVFLGLGENADILGHGYSFMAGLLCGFIPSHKSLRWGTPLSTADGIGLFLYYGLYLGAWALAL